MCTIARMPEAQTKDYSNLYIPAAIVIAGIIIGAFVMIGLSRPGSGTGATAQVKVNVKDVKTDGEPYIGSKDAPVTIAYWFDYQCPFCKAVDVGGIPQIPLEPAIPGVVKEYVDTGKVRIVFKDYAFLGPDSVTAALYSHSIWKLYPEKFYEWHVAMFTAQDEENGGFGDEASIVTLTRTVSGIDADAVKADVAAHKAEYQSAIDADKTEGTSMGVQGTPGFITGKTLIPGAVDFATLKQAIDEQL